MELVDEGGVGQHVRGVVGEGGGGQVLILVAVLAAFLAAPNSSEGGVLEGERGEDIKLDDGLADWLVIFLVIIGGLHTIAGGVLFLVFVGFGGGGRGSGSSCWTCWTT